jgi:putative tail protein
MLGSAVGGYIDPDVIKGPRLSDALTQTSRDGIPITFGWGTFRTAGNIIWTPTYPDGRKFREVKKKKRAGKGGPVQVTYSYYRTHAIGICAGLRRDDGTYDPITGVIQVYRNGKLVYDVRDDATLEAQFPTGGSMSDLFRWIAERRAGSSKFLEKARFYLGGEDQIPDSEMESFEGIGNVSAFKGLAYMVVHDDDVTETQGAVPQYEFVVCVNGVAVTVSNPLPIYAAGEPADEILSSVGPADWDQTIDSGMGGSTSTLIEGFSGGRLFHFSGSGEARTSGDSGATWSAVTGLPTTPIGYREIVSVIKLGAKFIAFPSDDYATDWYFSTTGNSFLPNPAYPFEALTQPKYGSASRGSIGIVGQGTGYIGRTGDSAESWEQFQADPSFIYSLDFIKEGGGFFYAASAVDNTKILRSPGGELGTWSQVDYPGRAPSKFIRGMAYGDDRLVVALSDGSTYYSDDSGSSWTVGGFTSSEIIGAHNCLIWSDGYFIGACGESFKIVTSPDSIIWTDAYSEPTTGVNARSLAASDTPCIGTPIPDAPGWFLQDDGTLCGPEGETISTDLVLLSTIVGGICKRCGLSDDDYDVSDLTDAVDGYRLSVQSDGVGMLLPLMSAFFFDAGEWDGKISFIKRGGPILGYIDQDDLVARDGPAIETTRSQEVELLRKVGIVAIDPAAGYMPTLQSAVRRSSTVSAKGELTVEIPITVDKDTQAQIADKRLKVPWSELQKFSFRLPYTIPQWTPTDPLGLTDKAGITHRIRLMEMGEESGVREVREAAQDRQSTYTSNVTGIEHRPPNGPISGLIGPTTLAVMDLPIWTGDIDDRLGVYVGGFGPLSGWAGAELQISTDAGETYTEAAQITEPATIGFTSSDLSAWASSEYPSIQSITVVLPDAPESISYEALLRYGNRAALQLDSGEWEILQYETVTPLGDNEYLLEGLVRGRYATTAGESSEGAQFVLLDGFIQFVQVDRALIDVPILVRAVSYGTDPDAYAGIPYTLSTPASQTEWPVHMVEAERDVSDNVTVTWIGRGRIGVETAPHNSVHFIGYRVTFDDGVTPVSFDTTNSTYTYNSAPDPVTVTVAALNDITGPGPASEGIIV